MNRQLQLIDFFLFGISLIAVIGMAFYFANISTPAGEFGTKDYDPFHRYYTEQGIVTIFAFRSLTWLTVLIVGIYWLKNKQLILTLSWVLTAAILILVGLQWIELWYGSTFYYGEVRDKQGLGLPVFTMFALTYLCIKSNKLTKPWKIALILAICLTTYATFNLVRDDWRLSYDIYIPGTNIGIY
ncbi:hypothetical protein [Marinoscillum sp. MHG1-6]|uniref:hypothetical protein n=1 Tax=Marinoscillum sp. MHG1-6 TaxID=2959627 RepID=UPI002157FF10|nr:hypothetical protein [Marinoscillum sp. MHG1-6]